jgi:hypothetical protein
MILSKADVLVIAQLFDRRESVHALAVDAARFTELTAYFQRLAGQCRDAGLIATIDARLPIVALCDICEQPITEADTEHCPHCGTVWAGHVLPPITRTS